MTEAPPVAVYLHWPYCARICPYCDFNVVRDRGRTEEQAGLAAAMEADLRAQAAMLGPRRLVSIFFGGGTPSLMPPEAAGRLIETARALFPSTAPIEVTLEANPTDAETARYRAFADAGVNRLSLGVQSLDDEALRFLGRDHDAASARRAVAAAQAVFGRVSIDLIYARPGQTAEAWRAELAEAIALAPEHVSPYQLTIEPETAFGRAHRRGTLIPPPEDDQESLYDVTQEVLEATGLSAYEVSNHARGEAARSAHNLAVWRGVEYLGVGPGAHGRLNLNGARTATAAHRRIEDYVAAVGEAEAGFAETDPLSPLAAAEERLMLGLRTVEGVALAALAPLEINARVEPLIEAGFLTLSSGRLAATPHGRKVLDGVIRALLV
ncbi:radical SAM family heme chaperone HemW [Brevundimonas sp.]|uniref:radical SAM family heme chaperone HemW n=1 Tax=Brevundimonas sp. TaxID=1871086 RepID=UPI0025F6AF6E|nr:radical SAM family heme chaperone HemW [Brevundimonas sp.]